MRSPRGRFAKPLLSPLIIAQRLTLTGIFPGRFLRPFWSYAPRDASDLHRDCASRRVKTPKPSNSAANGLVDAFTAVTPNFSSSGRRISSDGNEDQVTPS